MKKSLRRSFAIGGRLERIGNVRLGDLAAILIATATPAFEGKADIALTRCNVRYWPKADMAECTAHVRFQGQSRHDLLRMSAFAVAIGGKADMRCCTA